MSRKGHGSFQVELDKLKTDNDKLLELLQATSEYADMSEQDIRSVAIGRGIGEGRSRSHGRFSAKGNSPEWIPSEAVRALNAIKT